MPSGRFYKIEFGDDPTTNLAACMLKKNQQVC